MSEILPRTHAGGTVALPDWDRGAGGGALFPAPAGSTNDSCLQCSIYGRRQRFADREEMPNCIKNAFNNFFGADIDKVEVFIL